MPKMVSWYADIRTVGGEVIPYYLIGWEVREDDPEREVGTQDYLEDMAKGEIWGIYDDGDIDEKNPERAASIRAARAEHTASPFITTSVDDAYVQIARAHITSVRFRSEIKEVDERGRPVGRDNSVQ